MEVSILLRKIEQLEQRLDEVEAENVALKIENTHLKETLKQYADGKSSNPPKFGHNYSSQRNEPPDSKQAKRKKLYFPTHVPHFLCDYFTASPLSVLY